MLSIKLEPDMLEQIGQKDGLVACIEARRLNVLGANEAKDVARGSGDVRS